MDIRKASGLVAVAGLLLVSAPGERAQAASLINPGIAASVQDGALTNTTEVRWRHRHWRRHHHRHHHRHWHRW